MSPKKSKFDCWKKFIFELQFWNYLNYNSDTRKKVLGFQIWKCQSSGNVKEWGKSAFRSKIWFFEKLVLPASALQTALSIRGPWFVATQGWNQGFVENSHFVCPKSSRSEVSFYQIFTQIRQQSQKLFKFCLNLVQFLPLMLAFYGHNQLIPGIFFTQISVLIEDFPHYRPFSGNWRWKKR